MKLLALVVFCGCHAAETERAGRFPVGLIAQAPEADEVVATVEGRPIRASQVALQARARGTGAKQALSDLIDAEVLAGEATRRGLDRDRDAQEAAAEAAVRRLLKTGFESEVTPDTLPAGLIKHAYEKNKDQLDHEVMADLWHVIVPTSKLTDEGQIREARAQAEEIARKARDIGSAEQFKALAETVPSARAEHIVTERDGWTVKEFSYAAFDQLHKPGDTSTVVQTRYGFHVLYLVGYKPAVHIPLAQAEAQLRKAGFPEFQKPEFLRWSDRLAGSHQIELFPKHLK